MRKIKYLQYAQNFYGNAQYFFCNTPKAMWQSTLFYLWNANWVEIANFAFLQKKCFMHVNFLKGKNWMETWLLVSFQCRTDSVSLSPIVCPSTLTSDSFVSSVCFSLLSVKNCLTSSQKLRRHKVCTNTHKHTVILL